MIKAIKNIKNTKPTLLNLMISMLKRKMFLKKYDKQRSGKGKCFNYDKPRHFSKDCKQKPGKLKNKFNMINIDDKNQEELFRILESNNSIDSLEDDFSDSYYQSVDDSSDSPNIKIGCRDSCCNVVKLLMLSPKVKKMKDRKSVV